MGYFAGLDVSLEETAICIVDNAGLIVRGDARGIAQIMRTGWYRAGACQDCVLPHLASAADRAADGW